MRNWLSSMITVTTWPRWAWPRWIFTPGDHQAALAGDHAGHVQGLGDRCGSGFALWDGILSLSDPAALPTRHRDLAFLFACQTASGSTTHLAEAIHLAAAVQFLGYQHVIATMWIIADSPAPHVANAVYTSLTTGNGPDHSRATEALHRAIRALRGIDPTDPLLWAPYTHLGP